MSFLQQIEDQVFFKLANILKWFSGSTLSINLTFIIVALYYSVSVCFNKHSTKIVWRRNHCLKIVDILV